MDTIILIGEIVAIIAAIDVLTKPISRNSKIICIVALLLTSWLGGIVYFLYARDHITEWFNGKTRSTTTPTKSKGRNQAFFSSGHDYPNSGKNL